MITNADILKLKERVKSINTRTEEIKENTKNVIKLNKTTEALIQKTNKILEKLEIISKYFADKQAK